MTAVLTVAAPGAFAAESGGGLRVNDEAGAQSGAQSDVYVPTSAWLVGPAFLAQPAGMEKMKTPCVMANQYNNGYMFRYSGGGGKVMAMAVDFRQRAFKPGADYEIGVGIEPDYKISARASAYDEATLIVNLQDDKDFYSRLGKGHILAIDIMGKHMEFALLGLKDGLRRMEACYSPSAAPAGGEMRQEARQEQGQGQAQLSSLRPQEPMPMHTASFADAMPALDADGRAEPAAAAAMLAGPAALPAQNGAALPERAQLLQELQGTQAGGGQDREEAADSDAASADSADDGGDSGDGSEGHGRFSMFNSMLKTVAERLNISSSPAAGGDDLPSAGGNGRAAGEAPSSSAKPAGIPMARSWMPPASRTSHEAPPVEQSAAARLAPYLMPPRPQPAREQQVLVPVNPYPEDPQTAAYRAAAYQPAAAPAASAPGSHGAHGAALAPVDRHWRAMRGTNLRDILSLWAQSGQARLVWRSADDFPINESLVVRGGLNDAVDEVLAQYQGQRMRPVGKFYRDPATGQQILVIDEEHGN